MDPLTDALQTLQARGAMYWYCEMRGAWGLYDDAGPAAYHTVLEGGCYLEVPDHGIDLYLEAGDLIVLPRGDGIIMRDAPETPAMHVLELVAQHPPDERGTLRLGQGEVQTELVCGQVYYDENIRHPLLDALPPVIVLRRGEHEQTPWLRNTLGFIACEARSGRLGASALVGHLSNVLFIQAIRAHVAQTDAPAQGWLRGLMDPHIAPALAQIQQRPDASWTVESLAYEARLSRSAFSNRFRDVVGEPPMTFLTRWRMLEAARLLRTRRSDTLADVSALVGYESEASFSRTFKRVIGQSPGRYRSAARRTGLLV